MGDARSTGLVVRSTSRSTARQSALLQSLRERLEADRMPVASAQLVKGDRRVMEDHLLMVVGFLLMMAELTLVVGGLGLASTMSLAVLERTREIGVMRTIGASPFDIMRIVQIEGLLVSVTGFLIAIPLSLPMSVLLGRAFGRVVFPVPEVLMPSALALGVWLLVSVVVAIVASGWPARRAAAVPAAIAVAYE